MDRLKLIQYILIVFLCIVMDNYGLCFDRTVPIGLQLTPIEKFRDLPETSIYNDIMNHSKDKPFGDHHGRNTNAHETVHGINSYLRNKYYKELNKNINGFYAGNGYGILLENPKLRLRQVAPYVPKSVRGYRFPLYFEKQLADWDDTPTYHIDEWAAYIAGAECSVDDFNNKIIYSEKSDSVSGSLEFSIYCTALAMAVKNMDKNYWENNAQFKSTIQYFLIKAEKVFFEGKDIFPSQKQELLLNNLRNSEDCLEFRQFLKKEFQGVFVD